MCPSYQQFPYGRSNGLAVSIAMPLLPSLAHWLCGTVIPHKPKGFTFNPRTWLEPTFGPDIYLVSLNGRGERFDTLPDEPAVLNWLERVARRLSEPWVFIGGWARAGFYYLDLSVPILSRHAAEQMAFTTGETAIFDVASGESIDVDRAKWCERLLRRDW